MRDRHVARGPARVSAEDGASFLELLLVAALVVTLTTIAVPTVLAGVQHARAAGAARHMAGRFRLARMEAVKRSVNVGIRFEPAAGGYRYSMYADGDGDGVRNADIRRGVDRRLSGPDALSDLFGNVTFGLHDGVPYVDGAAAGSGADPVRVGSSNIMSFSPLGSATAGTVYILGGGGLQYAVRVLGVTGRTRVMKFNTGDRTWLAQ